MFFNRKKIKEADLAQRLKEGAARVRDVDIEGLLQRERELEEKFLANTALGELLFQARRLLALVKAYWRGEYRAVPRYTIAAVVAAFLYVLTPLDLLPDFIPFVGLLDDALMLSLCLRWVGNDLQAFEDWRLSRGDWIEGESR